MHYVLRNVAGIKRAEDQLKAFSHYCVW